ncbi:S1C family serine protease [Deinococcus sp. Marseille-Q6407]|uniref:S1C family serine protease n=1 Tax=Deinococcus sp. Marseille-Q6407 TaxID=2969223 RepID=UPI0021C19245|nr:S1C family serine protease [Deinococcus sp. Marseille-Q6407]
MSPLPWFRLPALLLLALLAYVLPAPGSGLSGLGGLSAQGQTGSGPAVSLPQRQPGGASPGARPPAGGSQAATTPAPLPTLPAETLRLFERSRPAVVRLGSLDPGAMTMGLGTGFFISPTGQLLTAYHVVSEGRLFQVQTLAGQRYPARLVGFDAAADVALLQVEAKGPFPYLGLSPRPPQVGEPVLAIGNSGGDFLQPREGRLLRLEAASGRPDFPQGTLEMDARLAPGDSGGPIINGLGQVIGVVSYIRVDEAGATETSYAVPTVEGNALITALRGGQQKDRGVVGLVFDIYHDGLTETPGGVVSRVAHGSPAEKAGLRGAARDPKTEQLVSFGDIIISVQGVRTRNANEVVRELQRYGVGETVTVRYLRGGKEYTAQLKMVPKRSMSDL